jgi:hypothetical protein
LPLPPVTATRVIAVPPCRRERGLGRAFGLYGP